MFDLLILSGTRDLNAALWKLSMGKTKKELSEIYEYATGERLSSSLICNGRVESKFRENFTGMLPKLVPNSQLAPRRVPI